MKAPPTDWPVCSTIVHFFKKWDLFKRIQTNAGNSNPGLGVLADIRELVEQE